MLNLKRSSSRRPLVGLDIEPGGIHAAQVSVNGHIVVDHAAFAPLEPGVVRDGEVIDAEGLAKALRDLFAEHDLDSRVRIGLANQRVVVRMLELPPISDPKELAAAVRFQAVDQVPMPLDQAVLDHVPLDVVETPDGPRQRVMIVAARRDMVERVLETAHAAGLRPEGIDLSAFAMLRALGATDAPVLHLAVGGVVNLAVARHGQCLFTRVVAGGLEQMAIELAERRTLTVERARELLRATDVTAPAPEADRTIVLGTAPVGVGDDEGALDTAEHHEAPRLPSAQGDAAEARTVLADAVRRIAADVRNSLDFHHGDSEAAVERVLLTGSAAAVPGFANALSERLALPVEAVAVDAPGAESPERFTVAAGLAVEEVR